MIYKDYIAQCKRLKGAQEALNRLYEEEFAHRNLIGKNVTVCYRFRGQRHKVDFYFERLEFMYHDVIPVFLYLKEGKPTNKRAWCIYTYNQIEEIKPQQQNE